MSSVFAWDNEGNRSKGLVLGLSYPHTVEKLMGGSPAKPTFNSHQPLRTILYAEERIPERYDIPDTARLYRQPYL